MRRIAATSTRPPGRPSSETTRSRSVSSTRSSTPAGRTGSEGESSSISSSTTAAPLSMRVTCTTPRSPSIAPCGLDGSTGNFGFVDPTTCKAWQKSAVASTNPRASNLAAFVQDSWRIGSDLTINAGIRYEEQRLYDASGDAAITLTGEWSPRVGAVWDPLRNGKSKVFASYGRYYQTIPQDIQVRALGNEVNVFAYNYTPDKSDTVASSYAYPFTYVAVGDYVPPGLKGMYQDEVIAGVEYEFARNWSVGVKGIYRALGRVLEDRCDLYDSRVQIGGLVPPGTIATCAMVNIGEGDLGQISIPTNPDLLLGLPEEHAADAVRVGAGAPVLPRAPARPSAPLRGPLLPPRELSVLEARGQLRRPREPGRRTDSTRRELRLRLHRRRSERLRAPRSRPEASVQALRDVRVPVRASGRRQLVRLLGGAAVDPRMCASRRLPVSTSSLGARTARCRGRTTSTSTSSTRCGSARYPSSRSWTSST